MQNGKYSDLTEKVIGCFYVVYGELGYGYNESIYSAALEIAFRENGIPARREHIVDVLYQRQKVGCYRLDYLIDDKVIIELKAGPELKVGARAQLVSYLRSAKRDVGLILYLVPTLW